MNLTADDATAAIGYSHIFSYEADFDYPTTRKWFAHYWHYCFHLSLAYVAVIFGLQSLMRSRPKLELRGPLVLWNGFLAVFSAMGAARVLPEMVHSLGYHGFVHSICDGSYLVNRVSGFWSFAFTLSKLPELGDTVFIVLRKQPLIFLHWYHHVITLCYVWHTYEDHIDSTGRWLVTLNYTVHAIMYSYYTLKAARVAIPRQISMLITLGQISQMLMGIYVTILAHGRKSRGEDCNVPMLTLKISLFLYFAFVILFAHFFCNAYLKRKAKSL